MKITDFKSSNHKQVINVWGYGPADLDLVCCVTVYMKAPERSASYVELICSLGIKQNARRAKRAGLQWEEQLLLHEGRWKWSNHFYTKIFSGDTFINAHSKLTYE